MKRLTSREGEKVIVKSKSENVTIGTFNDIAKRLADYEDTDLEPSEVEVLKSTNLRLSREWDNALTELAEKESEIEEFLAENKRLNDIVVKDNRHINKLDKENETNKQRIAVLERALELMSNDFVTFFASEAEALVALEGKQND